MHFTSDWFSANIPTWTKLLSHLTERPCHCLEIGSYEGRSAVWTLQNLVIREGSTLTCIDPWPDQIVKRRFEQNIEETKLAHRVHSIRGYSWAQLRKLPMGHYDFAYIDGCHEGLNVLEDAVHCFRLLKSGGIMCFDDYGHTQLKRHHLPKEGVNSFLGLYSHRVEVIHHGYQLFVRTN